MVDYLGLIINTDDFSTKGFTLESLTNRYGTLDNCRRDIKTIEKEIETLLELKEEYLNVEKDIEERIDFLSNLENKVIIKIKEHIKSDKYDYYSLHAQVLKISTDNKIIIDILENENFDYSSRGKVFNNYLEETLKKYPNSEIYSNKDIKYEYKDLEILKDLE